MKRFLMTMIFILTVCVMNMCFAEIKTIDAEGIYTVGDESPKVAKQKALDDAMRKAVDKAGIYIESYSKTEKFKLTKDEIKIIAGEVMQIVGEPQYKVESIKNNILRYTAIITAMVDTDVIDQKIANDKSKNLNNQDSGFEEVSLLFSISSMSLFVSSSFSRDFVFSL